MTKLLQMEFRSETSVQLQINDMVDTLNNCDNRTNNQTQMEDLITLADKQNKMCNQLKDKLKVTE
jgi:hypothetical protein